ncbi:MAG: hypothetical protein QXN37_01575 [Candidatus Anstonellaceae archaeon]
MEQKNKEKNIYSEKKDGSTGLKLFFRYFRSSGAMPERFENSVYEELLKYYGKSCEIQSEKDAVSARKEMIEVLKPNVEMEIKYVNSLVCKIEQIGKDLEQLRTELDDLEKEVERNIEIRKSKVDRALSWIKTKLAVGIVNKNSDEAVLLTHLLREAENAVKQGGFYPPMLRFAIEKKNKYYLVKNNDYLEQLNLLILEYELEQAQLNILYDLKNSILKNKEMIDSLQNVWLKPEKKEKLSKLSADMILEEPERYKLVELSEATKKTMSAVSVISAYISDTRTLIDSLERTNRTYDAKLADEYGYYVKTNNDHQTANEKTRDIIIQMLQTWYYQNQELQQNIEKIIQILQENVASYNRRIEELM